MDRLWDLIARRLVATGHFAAEIASSPSDAADHHSPDAGIPSERVFHDTALRFLDQQVAANREFDARTAQSFQIGSTVVTIAFGLLSLSETQVRVPHDAKISLYGALAAYGFVLAFSFWASLYRRIDYRHNVETVGTYAVQLVGVDLLKWVALEYQAETVINGNKLEQKSRLQRAAIICLYLEGTCFALAALFTLR